MFTRCFYILFLMVAVFGCATKAIRTDDGASTTCEEVKKKSVWKYCVTRMPNNGQNTLLYYFHGGGGNERSWADAKNYSSIVRKIWNKKGSSTPIVVTVSFGKQWLLAKKNSSSRSGLYEIFLKEVIPHIETTLGNKVTKRLILGESMGAFNAAQLAFTKSDMFAKVALLCPAIDMVYPSSYEVLKKYMKITGGKWYQVRKTGDITKTFFPDERSAKKQNPLQLAKELLGPKSPTMYISCGSEDEFGFYYGAKKLVKIANDKGVKYQWIPLKGNHCVIDVESLAKFLVTD